jgi:predicted PurR-regulated permease PerM
MIKIFINQDDKRIFAIISVTLIMLMLVTAYMVYHSLRSQTEEMAVSGLKVALKNATKYIENQIKHSIKNTSALPTRIALIQSMEKLNSDESREEGIIGVQQSAEAILTTHFSGIKIYDAEDNMILSFGANSNHPEFAVELDTVTTIETILLWDKQFIVRNAIQVLNEKQQPVGRIVTEEYMQDLTEFFKEATLIGAMLISGVWQEKRAV